MLLQEKLIYLLAQLEHMLLPIQLQVIYVQQLEHLVLQFYQQKAQHLLMHLLLTVKRIAIHRQQLQELVVEHLVLHQAD